MIQRNNQLWNRSFLIWKKAVLALAILSGGILCTEDLYKDGVSDINSLSVRAANNGRVVSTPSEGNPTSAKRLPNLTIEPQPSFQGQIETTSTFPTNTSLSLGTAAPESNTNKYYIHIGITTLPFIFNVKRTVFKIVPQTESQKTLLASELYTGNNQHLAYSLIQKPSFNSRMLPVDLQAMMLVEDPSRAQKETVERNSNSLLLGTIKSMLETATSKESQVHIYIEGLTQQIGDTDRSDTLFTQSIEKNPGLKAKYKISLNMRSIAFENIDKNSILTLSTLIQSTLFDINKYPHTRKAPLAIIIHNCPLNSLDYISFAYFKAMYATLILSGNTPIQMFAVDITEKKLCMLDISQLNIEKVFVSGGKPEAIKRLFLSSTSSMVHTFFLGFSLRLNQLVLLFTQLIRFDLGQTCQLIITDINRTEPIASQIKRIEDSKQYINLSHIAQKCTLDITYENQTTLTTQNYTDIINLLAALDTSKQIQVFVMVHFIAMPINKDSNDNLSMHTTKLCFSDPPATAIQIGILDTEYLRLAKNIYIRIMKVYMANVRQIFNTNNSLKAIAPRVYSLTDIPASFICPILPVRLYCQLLADPRTKFSIKNNAKELNEILKKHNLHLDLFRVISSTLRDISSHLLTNKSENTKQFICGLDCKRGFTVSESYDPSKPIDTNGIEYIVLDPHMPAGCLNCFYAAIEKRKNIHNDLYSQGCEEYLVRSKIIYGVLQQQDPTSNNQASLYLDLLSSNTTKILETIAQTYNYPYLLIYSRKDKLWLTNFFSDDSLTSSSPSESAKNLEENSQKQ
ncbi:hypothetical protein NEOKW01_1896 [Nematocida sp. AWRm80]|nr:hypothetical protein NEOKW01_1318 [Nematocida sp. AWRm80]KAI5181428.1 hypothetical protein NEOKW01_1609 [Nematocida sp. AWRm80]KAI5181732.1 hypothetical protein NEOKW01_1896 [Nematocida sp. AWRm80]